MQLSANRLEEDIFLLFYEGISDLVNPIDSYVFHFASRSQAGIVAQESLPKYRLYLADLGPFPVELVSIVGVLEHGWNTSDNKIDYLSLFPYLRLRNKRFLLGSYI